MTSKQLTAHTKRLAKARTDVERKRNVVASRRSLVINDTETAHLGKSSVRVNGLKQKPPKKPKTNLTTTKAPRSHSAHKPIINRGETCIVSTKKYSKKYSTHWYYTGHYSLHSHFVSADLFFFLSDHNNMMEYLSTPDIPEKLKYDY